LVFAWNYTGIDDTLGDRAKHYFEGVVRPNYIDYQSNSISFKAAYNLLNCLFNLHEWVYAYDRKEAEVVLGRSIIKSFDIWKCGEETVENASVVRDAANASKHVVLTRQPSTKMKDAQDTHILTVYYDVGDGEGGKCGACDSVTSWEG
jgi:hypothetical protein